MIVDWGRKEGVHFEIDAVESRPATAEIARNQSREYPEIHIVEADAFDFAPTDLYDAGFCSLALHQFSEEDALRVLSRLKAVVHGPVLVADLERSWSAAAGMWLVAAVWWRSHGVREEVRSSVRGAFSFDELAELARRAGWDGSMQKRFLFARQAIWIDPMPLTPVEPSSFLAISPAAP
jgi:SAM-dependent methyltransferase